MVKLRPLQDQVRRRTLHHDARIKKTEGHSLFAQTPRQQRRSGNLIELQARPIGRAVQPTVLGEAAVPPLNGSEPDQRAQGRASLASCEKRSRALDQVPSPYQMIATTVAFALGFAPGYAQGGDHSALKHFVFMGQQHATAQPVHSAAIARVVAKIEFWVHNGALPLPDIGLSMQLKRLSQR